ncbi:MAG TPA: right-handed parallel beta-helix repeat-containing protein [Verrucomicrobiae bacterium]|nr:right-handed parallel beta-helix repeat-containing protein [Verrucomicrobiae bacterium]
MAIALRGLIGLVPVLSWGYGNLQFHDARANIVNTLWDERQYDYAAFSNGIPWMISTNLIPGSTLSNISLAQFQGIVSNSFATWQSAPETKIRFACGGITTNNPSGTNIVSLPPSPKLDGDNVVGFGSLPSGVLGLTCQFVLNDEYTFTGTNSAFGGSDPDPDIPEGTYPSGTILDADIQLSTTAQWSVTGERDKIDIQATITHEIGHFIGLCHSVVGAPYPATMYPFAESNPDGLAARELYADDKAGVAAYYPSPSFATTFGSISGQIRRQDNSRAVPSAHVVARLTNDLSHVVACYADTNGQYRIDGLVPGGYILRVEPLPKAAKGATTGSIINDIVKSWYDVDFLPQVYANAAREADAALVAVAAAVITSNSNFAVRDGDVADLLEDDDTPVQARTISTDGKKEFHNIYPAYDVDCFSFAAAADKEYIIRTTDHGENAGAYTILTDSKSRILSAQKDPTTDSWIHFLPQTNGIYSISVRHADAWAVFSARAGAGTQYAVSIKEQTPVVHHVSGTAGSDSGGDGTMASPWATILYAINHATATANRPAALAVAAGTYAETVTIPSHLAVLGGFNPANWERDTELYRTIQAGNSAATVVVAADHSRLDGMVIQDGALGVAAKGRSTVVGNVITNNIQAISSRDPTAPVIINNRVTATSGGVACDIYDSYPVILGNSIIDNAGCGIQLFQNQYAISVEVADNLIAANRGGGAWCNGYREYFLRNVFVANSATDGGGISVHGSLTRSTIQDNVFVGNSASGGGGIGSDNARPSIIANRIVGNQATNGSGIRFYGYYTWLDSTACNNLIIGNASMAGETNAVMDVSKQSQNLMLLGNTVALNRGSALSIRSPGNDDTIDAFNNVFALNSGYGIWEGRSDADPDVWSNDFYANGHGNYWDYDTTNTYNSAADINSLVRNGPHHGVANNVDWVPEFVGAPCGSVAAVSYDRDAWKSVLIDSSAMLVPGALCGLTINPNTNQWLQFCIVTNTATTITVWGDMSGVATAGCAYAVFDWHLARESRNIDAGRDIAPWLNSDMDWESRPAGVGCDIGADEFVDGDGDDVASQWEARYGLNPSLADTDGDGMPDGWELAYRDPWIAGDGNLDADGDGMPDGGESIAGTDPDDRESLLRILSIDRSPTGSVELVWSSVPRKRYLVLSGTNLSLGSWRGISATNAATTGASIFTDFGGSEQSKFYRVQVAP